MAESPNGPLPVQFPSVMVPSVPCVGAVSIANVNGQSVASVPDIVTVVATSCGVDFETGLAVGGAFGGVPTVMVTVAGAEVVTPSLTVKVNESGPL